MSLFGDDDDGGAVMPRSRRAEASGGGRASGGGGGLFGDDADPWLPSPRKKVDIGSLLNDADIPDLYIDLFEAASRGNRLAMSELRQMMERANVTSSDQDRIAGLLNAQSDTTLTRGQANVAFLLIALAQQGETLSMDAVDDRKRSRLPLPDIAVLERPDESHTTAPAAAAPITPTKEQRPVSTATTSAASPRIASPQPQYTQSPRPAAEEEEQRPSTNGHPPSQQRQASQEDDPWSSGPSHQSPYQPASLAETTSVRPGPQQHSPSPLADFDSVIITSLPDREGMPLWKHINYSVKSSTRKTEVTRRYSDFAWLYECLIKKYPFRQVPLLPPKRLAGNGVYIRADASFLEKRRRGLVRFTNFLEQHPVLSQDGLVTTFLTVPSAGLTIQEEFEERYLAADLEASLPNGIEEWAQRTQLALRGAVDSFTELVHLQERIIKRRDSLAVDQLRFGLAMESFGEGERHNGAFNTLGRENGPSIARGLSSVAKYHGKLGGVREEEKRREEDGILENLKRHRDVLLSMSELFQRHAKGAGDNIPQLEKRIGASNGKIAAIEAKPEAGTPTAAASRVAELEKLRAQITADEGRIVKLKERRVLIRECIWRELQYFEKRQSFLPYLVGEYATTLAAVRARENELAERLAGDVE